MVVISISLGISHDCPVPMVAGSEIIGTASKIVQDPAAPRMKVRVKSPTKLSIAPPTKM